MLSAFHKILTSLFTLLLVALCSFLLGRAIPGGPFDGEKQLPPQIKLSLEQKYGLDKPPLVHFFLYLKRLILFGDFGVSMKFIDRPVADVLIESFPISLQLGSLALAFSIFIGVPLGILAAMKQNSWLDYLSRLLSVSGVTLPTFLVGALLVLLFCHTLGWLPPARLDGPEYFILPVITLGIRPAGIITRLIRSSLLEEMKLDYVRTARAKGLSDARIVVRHALRNCLLPLVTVLGPVSANILTGSFITEHFFAISGMAKHFVTAVTNRDVFLMMGVTLVFAFILIGINLLVDLIYPWLDPRMASR